MNIKLLMVSGSVLLGFAAAHAAPDLNDFAGNYTAVVFDLPARLVETYYNAVTMETRHTFDTDGNPGPNEQLVDVFFSEESEPLIVPLSFAANGEVTGLPGGGGSVTATPNGRLSLNLGDGDTTLFYPLPGLGLMFSLDQNNDRQQLIPLVRQTPVAVTPAELNGDWQYVALSAPRALREVYLNTVTEETRTSVDSQDSAGENEILVDTFLTAEPESFRVDATFSGGSTVTGDVGGSFVVDGDGRAVLTLGGGDSIFQVTPDRNVMVGLYSDALVQELGFMLRKGTLPSAADLAGSWRFFTLSNTGTLRETFLNLSTQTTRVGLDSQEAPLSGERLVNLDGDEAEVETGAIRFHADGTAGGATDGTFSISPEGTLLFNDGEVALEFVISAGRDLLVTTVADNERVGIVVVIREPRLAIARTGGALNIEWGGAAPGTLQKTTDDFQTWQNVGPVAPGGSVIESLQSTGAVHYRILPED